MPSPYAPKDPTDFWLSRLLRWPWLTPAALLLALVAVGAKQWAGL